MAIVRICREFPPGRCLAGRGATVRSEGQRPTADELLKELTSAEIELEAVAEYVRNSLAAA